MSDSKGKANKPTATNNSKIRNDVGLGKSFRPGQNNTLISQVPTSSPGKPAPPKEKTGK